MKPRINPAVLAVMTTHWLMEPSALAQMQQRLMALPANVDLTVKYAPKGDFLQSFLKSDFLKADLFDDDDDGDRPKTRKPYEMAGGVAVIRLSGPLQKDPSWLMRYFGGTSTRAFIAMLSLAEGDPDVTKICVMPDSPGGDVDGTADAADAVYAVRMRGKKPIVAAVDGICCSAAFWIACQCSKVYCGQTSVVGSIGTRWSLLDTSAYYEQLGIKKVEVTSGTYKAAGADGLPIGADDKAYFQSIVDDMQARFSAGVVRGRKLSVDAVRALAADAKIYVGKAALDAGLVDEILPVRDVIRQLQKGAASGGANQSASSDITQSALKDIFQAVSRGTTASGGGKGTSMADNNKKGMKAKFMEFMASLNDDGDDDTQVSSDPAVLGEQIQTLTAEKTKLAAQVESLTGEKATLESQVQTMTAEKETLTTAHAALTERVKGIDEAEQNAQKQALEEARTAATAAATTAFGASSAELAQAQTVIDAQVNAGVLASMTSAYKAATPKTLRPGAVRQTTTPPVITTEEPTPEQAAKEQQRADALDPAKVYAKRRTRAS